MARNGAVPTVEELVARARALAPKLRARSDACETARRVPEETIADFLDNGFHRMMQPKRFGGYEYGWDALCECAIEWGRGCGSQAWVMMVYKDHVQKIGMCSAELQDEIWGEDPQALVSSAFQPVGRVEKRKDGYAISGKWAFSSGIDHAKWLIVGGMLAGESGPPQWTYFIVPRSVARIVDDWHVAGLAGTGSKSFTIDEAFVPAHRTIGEAESTDGKGPGVTPDSPAVYRYPRKGAGLALASVPVGIATGMLDDFKAIASDKARRGRRALADPATALRVAESSAELDAAWWALVGAARETMRALERGETLSKERRLLNRRNAGFAAMMAQRASERLYAAAGGTAIYKSSSMQRSFRDVHAGANHIGVSWDFSATAYGEYMIGHGPAPGGY
jgi:alkylation response protein AidB-like acyl-CoA dehydrogenase